MSSKHEALKKKKGTEHNEENVEYNKSEEGTEDGGKKDAIEPKEHARGCCKNRKKHGHKACCKSI